MSCTIIFWYSFVLDNIILRLLCLAQRHFDIPLSCTTLFWYSFVLHNVIWIFLCFAQHHLDIPLSCTTSFGYFYFLPNLFDLSRSCKIYLIVLCLVQHHFERNSSQSCASLCVSYSILIIFNLVLFKKLKFFANLIFQSCLVLFNPFFLSVANFVIVCLAHQSNYEDSSSTRATAGLKLLI